MRRSQQHHEVAAGEPSSRRAQTSSTPRTSRRWRSPHQRDDPTSRNRYTSPRNDEGPSSSTSRLDDFCATDGCSLRECQMVLEPLSADSQFSGHNRCRHENRRDSSEGRAIRGVVRPLFQVMEEQPGASEAVTPPSTVDVEAPGYACRPRPSQSKSATIDDQQPVTSQGDATAGWADEGPPTPTQPPRAGQDASSGSDRSTRVVAESPSSSSTDSYVFKEQRRACLLYTSPSPRD